MNPIDFMTALMAGLVVWRLGSVANAMNGTTDHWMRAALVLLIVGALGMALAPLYPQEQAWARLIFVAGVAAWVHAERRRDWT